MRPVSATALDLGQLREGGDAGLVHHHVLATPHRREGQRGAVAREHRGHDDVDRGVVQQPLTLHRGHPGEALAEARQHARVGGLGQWLAHSCPVESSPCVMS
jgi:hypothetical protein